MPASDLVADLKLAPDEETTVRARKRWRVCRKSLDRAHPMILAAVLQFSCFAFLTAIFLLKVLVDWATVSSVTQNNPQQPQQQQQQQHFNGSNLPSTSGHQYQGQNVLLKPRNNRTPGEGTCYEIGESLRCALGGPYGRKSNKLARISRDWNGVHLELTTKIN